MRFLLAAAAALLLIPATASAAVTPGSLAQRSNVAGLTNAQYMNSFVVRDGSRLSVDGHPFRWNGGNVEWLGLENYGPNPSATLPVGSERYATPYEINDAFATLHEMGATVVRVQTLGDTVGCAMCIEPARNQFNPAAFHETDLVVAAARRWGIKLIGEFDGDANGSASGVSNFESHAWYCVWEHVPAGACESEFFSRPNLLADYEAHMRAVLDHVNPYTGLAYKDDPTILGWVDGNNLNLLSAQLPTTVESWLSEVSSDFKSLDSHQLFIDISLTGAELLPTASILKIPGIDVYGEEYYPHWFPVAQGGDRLDGEAPLLHSVAKTVADAGKAYATIEFGWDHTNFLTQAALGQFLNGLQADPNVAGDGFWALVGHASGHGWQPIPANGGCVPTCQELEDGNWWAMYYTGVTTLSNTAADMAARAQELRAHAYEIDGFAQTPPHEIVPAPVITSTAGATVQFEGSAGAPDYSVQKRSGGTWTTPCDRCTTDADNGWKDPSGAAGCYRVIGWNLAGVAGPASAPAGVGCPKASARPTRRRARAGRSRHRAAPAQRRPVRRPHRAASR